MNMRENSRDGGMNTSYSKNIKRSFLFAFGGMLFIVGVLLLSDTFWTPNVSLVQKVLISFKLSLAVFLPIVTIGIFFSSIAEIFSKEKTSKKIASVVVLLGVLVFSFSIFSVMDRVGWSQRVEGMINVQYVPVLKNKELCKKNILVEYAPDGKYVIFRCGEIFYPLYSEYNMTEKEFVQIIQNISLENIKKNKEN